MRFTLFILMLFVTMVTFGQKGTVAGTITDKDLQNEPLPFASVSLKGTTIGVSTDNDGKYSLSAKPGDYVLVLSFVGYESVEVPVTIKADETVTIDRALGSGSVTLQDVQVQTVVNREKETALLLEQKNAVEMKQAIGAQEMSRKGVTTVEGGVTKISGVTKVGDRGIFIRGLDDRYNYLQINGLNFIPSDPNLKTIPLSFIPTDIVRNLDLYKTFNASLYQDFAGGTINVMTKDISSEPFTKISLSVGLNDITTFRDFKTSDEGAGDFFGYTGDKRNLPAVFGEGRATGYQATPSESANLFNSSWTPDKSSAPLNTGFGIVHSDNFELTNDRKIGYIMGINFGNSFLAQTGERRNLNSEGTAFKDFDYSGWRYKTQKSGLASVTYRKPAKYNFMFNAIYFQNSENAVEEIAGENTDFITIDRPFFLRDMKYVENTSFGLQHLGTLYFKEKKNTLDYGVAATIGRNDMPDRKTLIAEGVGEDADYVTFNGADPFRYYSVLDNFNLNGKVEYEMGFGEEVNAKSANILKFGVNADMTSYDFFNRTIRVNGGGNLTDTNMSTDTPQQFFNANFANGNLYYVSNSDPTYKNEISQFITAGFVNYTRNWEKLVFDVGVRVEYQFRETKYRLETVSVNSPYQIKEYAPVDFNPVINLKYLLNDKTNLRFTASKTSTKPRMREILPFRYQDGDGNFTIGNPDIKNTQNYNVDLKYEVFPTSGSLFGVAVFGKHIKNPIDRLLEGTSTGFLTRYDNFDTANLYGLEMEASFGLDLLFGEQPIFKKTSFMVNAIAMKSKEEADPDKFPRLTSSDRALQGASDFIINADVSYEIAKNEKIESKASIIYNSFSSRIYAVGTDGASDIEQKPIHQLDFTWRNNFAKKYELNFVVRNILNAEFLLTQDPTRPIANPTQFSNVNNRLTQGVNFGLEFVYTF